MSIEKDVTMDPTFLYETLCKTLPKSPKNKHSSLSLPLTEVTVNLIEKTITNKRRCLGKLDVNYASFILNQACLSPTSVMIAMIYLDRLKKCNSEYLERMSSSELFLASLIVASKFLFDKDGDEMIYNDEWASFANLELSDLNKLEREFLDAIKWSCFVDQKTFMEQVVKFEGLISLNEYSKRKNDSMTYMELLSFFKYLKHFHKDDQFIWKNIVDIIQSIFICTTAYFLTIGIVLISSSLVFTVQNRLLMESYRQPTTELNPLNQLSFDLKNSTGTIPGQLLKVTIPGSFLTKFYNNHEQHKFLNRNSNHLKIKKGPNFLFLKNTKNDVSIKCL